jgi:hypothetical protein
MAAKMDDAEDKDDKPTGEVGSLEDVTLTQSK